MKNVEQGPNKSGPTLNFYECCFKHLILHTSWLRDKNHYSFSKRRKNARKSVLNLCKDFANRENKAQCQLANKYATSKDTKQENVEVDRA